jgi:hypothetical protein
MKTIPFWKKNKPPRLQGLTGTHQTTTDNTIISHAVSQVLSLRLFYLTLLAEGEVSVVLISFHPWGFRGFGLSNGVGRIVN